MIQENLVKDQGYDVLFGDHCINSHNLISKQCMDIVIGEY